MNIFQSAACGFAGVCVVATSGALAIGPCVPVWNNGPGSPGMASSNVTDLKVWDAPGDGVGDELYAIGGFAQASGTPGTSQIARWQASTQSWQALGSGLAGGFSNALEVHDGALIAGGYFDSAGGVAGTAKLARWNGTTWSSMDAQLSDSDDAVWSLKSWDDGDGAALYVGGNYLDIGGGASGINHLARYDGKSYSLVGGGTIGGPVPPLVAEIETWDDGSGGGEALYIGGRFTEIAGVQASRIAKWDGTSWSALGTGITGAGLGVAVYAIQPWDDGSGPSLFIGGQSITAAGGVPTTGVARWDGTQWHAVGGGISPGVVWDLEVFDDGSGEALYAVGTFTAAGGNSMNRIAKWDGNVWSPVGTGTGADASVFCAKSFDDGTGPPNSSALYIGGSFVNVETIAASRVARYQGCTVCSPVDVDCNRVVNIDDLLIVINSWGQTGPPGTIPADVNEDGVVNIDDLLTVINNWG